MIVSLNMDTEKRLQGLHYLAIMSLPATYVNTKFQQ